MTIGYTEKQINDLVVKIDKQADKACGEIEKLFALVPDKGLTPSSVIDELLFRTAVLKDIVRRRRRSS